MQDRGLQPPRSTERHPTGIGTEGREPPGAQWRPGPGRSFPKVAHVCRVGGEILRAVLDAADEVSSRLQNRPLPG